MSGITKSIGGILGSGTGSGSLLGGAAGWMVGGPAGAAIGAGLGGTLGGSMDASQAAEEAAKTQAAAQTQALNYLKQVNQLPLELRDQALKKLESVYLSQEGQADIIKQAQASPLYGAIMGGQKAGEEAILRNAAATGGLRSGNTQYNLADYNTQLQNNALLQAYGSTLGGIQSLAGLGTNENNIANMMAGIGATQAQGQAGAAQAQQQGISNLLNMGLTTAGLYASGGLGGLSTLGSASGGQAVGLAPVSSNPFGITSQWGLI